MNSSDTSISYSGQLDAAIPVSTIASLSSSKFVGMVADNPDQRINLKAFHAEIINDPAVRKQEEKHMHLAIIRTVTPELVRNITTGRSKWILRNLSNDCLFNLVNGEKDEFKLFAIMRPKISTKATLQS